MANSIHGTLTEYSLELPLPPKQCSPNGRYHWAEKAKEVKAYRQAVGEYLFYVHKLAGAFEMPVIIDLEFYLCRKDVNYYYPRDEDNARASFKSGQDALVDAGVVPSDSKKNVRAGSVKLYTRAKEHKGRTCVVMTIRTIK